MEQILCHSRQEETDAALLTRYRAEGDVAAMDDLVRRHSRMLARYLRGILKNVSDTEEVLQAAWINAMRNAEKFSGDNVVAWLLCIAHNAALDHLRKWRSARPHLDSLDAESDDERSLLALLRDPLPDPARIAESTDLLQFLLRHITNLPEKFREVFLLRVTSDMTFDTIAKLQGTPVSTTMTRMDAAVQKLRKAILAEGTLV